MKKIFLFTFLFTLFANVNPGYSWNIDSNPDENLKEVQELMKACKSPRWDDDEDILSDYDMRDVIQEENKCLKKVAIDIINKNFSFKKNQKFRDEMIATLDQLEQSFGTVYYNYVNMSDRCIEDEDDILSCGSIAAHYTPALWREELERLIEFMATYRFYKTNN